jgi:exonuclease SbcC
LEKELHELSLIKIKSQGIREKRGRREDLEKLNNSLETDISILEEQTKTLQISILELSKFDTIFEKKQADMAEASKEERMAEIKVAELKREIDVFSAQIEETRQRIQKIEEIKKQAEYLGKLEDWLTNRFIPVISFIEKNVMVKLKAEFSQLFGDWFNMLVSESFNVRLDSDFTPIIEQQDYELDYAYLSGGERTAIALAYRLSLNQVINSLLSKIKTRDLVILDEPTDGFSTQQLDRMRDVLEELDVSQLIIVSHEQKMEDYVENVIKFKKENGVSVKAE